MNLIPNLAVSMGKMKALTRAEWGLKTGNVFISETPDQKKGIGSLNSALLCQWELLHQRRLMGICLSKL